MTGRTYRVTHRTDYRYGSTMTDGYTVTCLVPRPTEQQIVHDSEVTLIPPASEWDSYLDAFGNLVHQFGLHDTHTEMAVEAVSVVELAQNLIPVDATPWEDVVGELDAADGDLALEVLPFRASSRFVDLGALGERLAALARNSFTPRRPIVEAIDSFNCEVFESFDFDAHFSNVSTPLADVLEARRGVCQDFAHLAVGAMRAIGLAARYVSGYIETVPPPGQERLIGADASHAWCSVWTSLAGWVDFDPTNGHLPVNDHITVGWGRDYADVIPVRGVMIGPSTDQSLEVAVDVVRIDDVSNAIAEPSV